MELKYSSSSSSGVIPDTAVASPWGGVISLFAVEPSGDKTSGATIPEII
jgi:hypothetical protein